MDETMQKQCAGLRLDAAQISGCGVVSEPHLDRRDVSIVSAFGLSTGIAGSGFFARGQAHQENEGIFAGVRDAERVGQQRRELLFESPRVM